MSSIPFHRWTLMTVTVLLLGTGQARAAGMQIPLDEAIWTFAGTQTDEYLGYSVNAAGNLNGDAYDDLIVGAPAYDEPGWPDTGRAWVFYGAPGGPGTVPDVTLAALELRVSGSFGAQVAGTGDVNDDGYDDFLVAAAKFDALADREGLAMLFYGSANGLDPDGSRPVGSPANADWFLVGASAIDILGYSTAAAADVNGDGIDDFLIGVFGYDATGDNGEGLAQLWLGSSSGPIPAPLSRHVDCFVEGVQLGEHLGTTVAGVGDVDGDGLGEFASGAIYWDTSTETNAGRVYLFSGIPLIAADDFESGDTWRWSLVVP